MFKKARERPFLLTYGVPIPDHRSGGITEKYVEGYQISREPNSPYRFALNVTASSERIWPTVLELAAFVRPECMAVLEVHGRDAVTTYVTTAYRRERVLEVLAQYAFQLVHDGFTAFGLASQAVEVFVRDHKEIHIDCQEVREIQRALQDLGFEEKRHLSLLGASPHYHCDLAASIDTDLAKMAEPWPSAEVERFRRSPTEYNGFRDSIIRQLDMTVQSRVPPRER